MRYKVNRRKGANQFKQRSKRTKMINLAPPPMRGGYRL